jgi:hypothetical protein
MTTKKPLLPSGREDPSSYAALAATDGSAKGSEGITPHAETDGSGTLVSGDLSPAGMGAQDSELATSRTLVSLPASSPGLYSLRPEGSNEGRKHQSGSPEPVELGELSAGYTQVGEGCGVNSGSRCGVVKCSRVTHVSRVSSTGYPQDPTSVGKNPQFPALDVSRALREAGFICHWLADLLPVPPEIAVTVVQGTGGRGTASNPCVQMWVTAPRLGGMVVVALLSCYGRPVDGAQLACSVAAAHGVAEYVASKADLERFLSRTGWSAGGN